MALSRSIAFDGDALNEAASAAGLDTAISRQEAALLEGLKAGRREAFDTLIERFSSDIFATLYRITEDAEEAADLTQETFISAARSVAGFRGDSGLKTWLYRIAINHARNRKRWWFRRGRSKTISIDSPIGPSEQTIGDTLDAGSRSPEDEAIWRERQLSLRRALNELPEIFREAVVLCDIEGLSYDEIAEVLGISMGTVKSRIARGRDELRRKLKGY